MPAWALAALFAVLVLATRWPLAPGQLFSFDDVNFAYSLGDFDVRASQPHPPGYPLFVAQARVLEWLRFKRPESNFFALSMVGSVAALVVLASAGNRILGRDSGFCAAWLLLLHPCFWYATLTSAVRPQLALVSIAVAAACHRAWSGERGWIVWSALVLGLGSGIRPELGPLLLPLWIAAVLRTRPPRREVARGAAVLAASVAVWLIPTMLESGGPAEYVKFCREYLADQASLTSAAFGAETLRWQTTLWWLITWTFIGVLAWPLPLAISRPQLSGDRLAFLALWLGPPLLFAAVVHIADPGQALAVVVPVTLFGGYLLSRALDVLAVTAARWRALAFLFLPVGLALSIAAGRPVYSLAAIAVVSLAAGLMAMRGRSAALSLSPRPHALIFLLLPSVVLSVFAFYTPVWYSAGPLEAIHSGLAATSLAQIRATLAVDDANLRAMQALAAERPGSAVVVWERGATSWRKTTWYAAGMPVIVLERQKLDPRSPIVVSKWQGPRLIRRATGSPQVGVPAGTRIIWFLKAGSDTLSDVARQLPLSSSGPLFYTDLPAASGQAQLGAYRLEW